MPPADTARNRRIVRLRDAVMEGGGPSTASWRWIAARISKEFPDEAIGHKRCQDIYNYIVNNRPPALNGGAWRRAQKEKEQDD